MKDTGVYNLNINCTYVINFDESLYNSILKYPEELLALLHIVVQDMYSEMFPNARIPPSPCLCTYSLFEVLSWNEQNPS